MEVDLQNPYSVLVSLGRAQSQSKDLSSLSPEKWKRPKNHTDEDSDSDQLMTQPQEDTKYNVTGAMQEAHEYPDSDL
jgi:hypothetical protein